MSQYNFQIFAHNDQEIAHFWQHGRVTVTKLFRMLDIFLEVQSADDPSVFVSVNSPHCGLYLRGQPSALSLQEMSPDAIVPTGEYDLLTRPDKLPLEHRFTRTRYFGSRSVSVNTASGSNRRSGFSPEVKTRDAHTCVVSGLTSDEFRLDAAHIIPRRAFRDLDEGLYGAERIRNRSRLDDVSNGITLEKTIHIDWDSYHFSIDVDDGYKVVAFKRPRNRRDDYNDGETIAVNGEPPKRMNDEHLRWHFEQAVLANMRAGAGSQPLTPKDDDHEGPISFDRQNDELCDEVWSTSASGKRAVENYLSMRLAHLAVED